MKKNNYNSSYIKNVDNCIDRTPKLKNFVCPKCNIHPSFTKKVKYGYNAKIESTGYLFMCLKCKTLFLQEVYDVD